MRERAGYQYTKQMTTRTNRPSNSARKKTNKEADIYTDIERREGEEKRGTIYRKMNEQKIIYKI